MGRVLRARAQVVEQAEERVRSGVSDPPRDEDILVRERDRGSAVQLGDEAVEARSGGLALPDATEAPQDARGAPDAPERSQKKTPGLSPDLHPCHQGELLDGRVRLLAP